MMRLLFALLAFVSAVALLSPVAGATSVSSPVLVNAMSPTASSILALVATGTADFTVVVQNLTVEYNYTTGGALYYYSNVSCPSSACWASSTPNLYYVIATGLNPTTEYAVSCYVDSQGPSQASNSMTVTTLAPPPAPPTNSSTPAAHPANLYIAAAGCIAVAAIAFVLGSRQRRAKGGKP